MLPQSVMPNFHFQLPKPQLDWSSVNHRGHVSDYTQQKQGADKMILEPNAQPSIYQDYYSILP